jgi:hypothetical protein
VADAQRQQRAALDVVCADASTALRAHLRVPSSPAAARAPSSSSSAAAAGAFLAPTVLRTGLETLPLYLARQEDGGARLVGADPDGPATGIVDDELAQVRVQRVCGVCGVCG